MQSAKTLTTSIACPSREVYDFVRNPENLPRWASGIGENLRREGSRWMIDMPFGPVEIRFVDSNDFGVLVANPLDVTRVRRNLAAATPIWRTARLDHY